MLWKECNGVSAYRMENPFSCNIKCSSHTIGGTDPVNYPLPMSILIIIHFTTCIPEGIPVLSHSKVRFTCIHVIPYITTPKPSDKVKPPSIIPNFFPEGYTVLKEKYTILYTLSQQTIFSKYNPYNKSHRNSMDQIGIIQGKNDPQMIWYTQRVSFKASMTLMLKFIA